MEAAFFIGKEKPKRWDAETAGSGFNSNFRCVGARVHLKAAGYQLWRIGLGHPWDKEMKTWVWFAVNRLLDQLSMQRAAWPSGTLISSSNHRITEGVKAGRHSQSFALIQIDSTIMWFVLALWLQACLPLLAQ